MSREGISMVSLNAARDRYRPTSQLDLNGEICGFSETCILSLQHK